MASTNKSEKLGLSLWEETDKPERADFVSDNEIVEELLGEHLDNTTAHVTETEKAFLGRPIGTIYTMGDGKESKTIDLSVYTVLPTTQHRFVVVWAQNKAPVDIDEDGTIVYRFGFAEYPNVSTRRSTSGIGTPYNKVIVLNQQDVPYNENTRYRYALNERGVFYYITVFG